MLTGEEQANQHSSDLVVVQGSPVSAGKPKDVTYHATYFNIVERF